MKVNLHEEDYKEINFCISRNLKIPKDVRQKIYKIVIYNIQKATKDGLGKVVERSSQILRGFVK